MNKPVTTVSHRKRFVGGSVGIVIQVPFDQSAASLIDK